jgi:hypothetical protein
VALGLAIDEKVTIGGDLDYTAGGEFDIPSGVVAGDTTFTPDVGATAHAEGPSAIKWLGNTIVQHVRRLITLLIAGALMMWLIPDWSRRVSGIVRAKPLPSLGRGAVALLVLAVAAVAIATAGLVVAILLGFWRGVVVSVVGFSLITILLTMTQIVVSLMLGQVILKLFKSTAAEHRWWPLVLGVPVFVAITAVFYAVPALNCCLGPLIWAVAACLGLGAMWTWGRERLAGDEAPPEEDAPVPPTAESPPA